MISIDCDPIIQVDSGETLNKLEWVKVRISFTVSNHEFTLTRKDARLLAALIMGNTYKERPNDPQSQTP